MTAEEYEHHVADVLAREGWHTEVTPRSGDLGLDVIAQRDGTRLGVQVKKYGGSQRKVNADEVMKLHGAARYRDCDQALLVTDGDCWPAAEAVAAKLQIAIRTIPALDHLEVLSTSAPGESGDRRMSFDTIWSTHVEPLRGTERWQDESDPGGRRGRDRTADIRPHAAAHSHRNAPMGDRAGPNRRPRDA